MCLAVPTRVRAIDGQKAEIEIAGITRKVDITLTPEIKLGDFILVHAGYAISIINEQEAQETLMLLQELVEKNEIS